MARRVSFDSAAFLAALERGWTSRPDELGAPFFVIVEEAMALTGVIDHPTVRLPAVPLDDDSRARSRVLLTGLGIL